MGQADNAKWNSCTMFSKSHSGGVIATLKGTGSIKDCAMACAYRGKNLELNYCVFKVLSQVRMISKVHITYQV